MVFTSQLRGAWDTMRQLLPAELAEQAAVHLETLSDAAQPYIQTVRVDVNQRLKDLEPAEIVMLTAAALLLAYLALSFIQWLLRPFRERGVGEPFVLALQRALLNGCAVGWSKVLRWPRGVPLMWLPLPGLSSKWFWQQAIPAYPWPT